MDINRLSLPYKQVFTHLNSYSDAGTLTLSHSKGGCHDSTLVYHTILSLVLCEAVHTLVQVVHTAGWARLGLIHSTLIHELLHNDNYDNNDFKDMYFPFLIIYSLFFLSFVTPMHPT